MLGAGLFAGLGPIAGLASSHREAPFTAENPKIDNTDLYAFVSPDKPNTVTIINNVVPFEEPAGGPNFYSFQSGARYDINIDNNGDGVADLTYRFTFTDHRRNPNTFLYNTGPVNSLTDPNLNFFQTYTLRLINDATSTGQDLVKNAVVVPSDVGNASMPNYASLLSAGINAFGNSRVFAGQADDPFFLDLRVFDLLYGANLSEVGTDTLKGFNVQTMALQVPKKLLALKGDPTTNPIVGVWASTSMRTIRTVSNDQETFSGSWTQVSRLGNPLVNEVIIPVGQKDYWNSQAPAKDGTQFLTPVTDPEVPKLIQAIYSIPAPATPRNDLIQVLYTGVPRLNKPPNPVMADELRLNMSTPVCNPGTCGTYSRLGVIGGDNQGYPNGRRLADDVIDIDLQVLEGFLLGQKTGLGDGVNANDKAFQASFPYVAAPTSGSNPTPHA